MPMWGEEFYLALADCREIRRTPCPCQGSGLFDVMCNSFDRAHYVNAIKGLTFEPRTPGGALHVSKHVSSNTRK